MFHDQVFLLHIRFVVSIVHHQLTHIYLSVQLDVYQVRV